MSVLRRTGCTRLRKPPRKEKTQTRSLWWQIQPSPLLRKPFPLVHLTWTQRQLLRNIDRIGVWSVSIVGTNTFQKNMGLICYINFQIYPQVSQFKSKKWSEFGLSSSACWKDLREPSTKMGHATPSWSAKRASTASGVTSCTRRGWEYGWPVAPWWRDHQGIPSRVAPTPSNESLRLRYEIAIPRGPGS